MKQIRLILNSLAVITLSLTIASFTQAQSQRAYVAIEGSDGNPCARTSPCRTISQALSVVASGGEVIILDSGDYDPFKVTKAVTVEAPPGVNAAVAGNSDDAVAVLAGASDMVVIRGLHISITGRSVAMLAGIGFSTGGALHVENCVIQGLGNLPPGNFASNSAIAFSGSGLLFVKDSIMRNSNTGVDLFPHSMGIAVATLDGCRMENNGTGLRVGYDAAATVRNSIVIENLGGFSVAPNINNPSKAAKLAVENCLITANGIGIEASNYIGNAVGHANISNSIVTNNQTGIFAYPNGIIAVENTTITHNKAGLKHLDSGRLFTAGNNKLLLNETDGTFTDRFGLQ